MITLSAPSLTSGPLPEVDLIDLLAQLDGAEHQAARVETFISHEDGTRFDLIRCRCGGMYGTAAFDRHLTKETRP